MRQILEYSSQPLITLQEELDLLKLYVELEQLRFENKFFFKINIDKSIATRDTYVPPLILNPIVENAIWHGLLPLQGIRAGQLVVDIQLNEKKLSFLINDKGVRRNSKQKPLVIIKIDLTEYR